MDEHDVYKIVGERIRARRQEADITQNDLAEMVSLSRTSVTNIERGIQSFNLTTLYAIAKALSVKPHELLPDPDEEDQVRPAPSRMPASLRLVIHRAVQRAADERATEQKRKEPQDDKT